MKIFVAMSGGVDSAVAALLLLREGHEVVGIHLRTGVQAGSGLPGRRPRCCGADEAADARRVCALLDIPFYVQNTADEFGALIRDFVEAYARGKTPNPCVACNNQVKFGALLRRARGLGAEAVATGHYARRVRYRGRWAVARGLDAGKDQAYVLYALGQDELERARFPLGELTKSEVREIAREAGLPVASKAESQEICFVPSDDYRDLVRRYRPDALDARGEIVDEEGRVLGEHHGVAGFTVGQRRGLGIAAAAPLYVLRLDAGLQQVVVGPRESLGVTGTRVRETLWTAIKAPTRPIRAQIMLRYRARPAPATIQAVANGETYVNFTRPAQPVAPGQAAVFFDDDEGAVVLGGGRLS